MDVSTKEFPGGVPESVIMAFSTWAREQGKVSELYAGVFDAQVEVTSKSSLAALSRATGIYANSFIHVLQQLDGKDTPAFTAAVMDKCPKLQAAIEKPGLLMGSTASDQLPAEKTIDASADFSATADYFHKMTYRAYSDDLSTFRRWKEGKKETEDVPLASPADLDGAAALTSGEAQARAAYTQAVGLELVAALEEAATRKDKDGNPTTLPHLPLFVARGAALAMEGMCSTQHAQLACTVTPGEENLGVKPGEYYAAMQNAILRGVLADVLDQAQQQHTALYKDKALEASGAAELSEEEEQVLQAHLSVVQTGFAGAVQVAQQVITGAVDNQLAATKPYYAASEGVKEWLSPEGTTKDGKKLKFVRGRQILEAFKTQGLARSEPGFEPSVEDKKTALDTIFSAVPPAHVAMVAAGVDPIPVTKSSATPEQLELLKALPAVYAEGHAWSRALTGAVFGALFKKRSEGSFLGMRKKQARFFFVTEKGIFYGKPKSDLMQLTQGGGEAGEDLSAEDIAEAADDSKSITFKKQGKGEQTGECHYQDSDFGTEGEHGCSGDSQFCLVITAHCDRSAQTKRRWGKTVDPSYDWVLYLQAEDKPTAKGLLCAIAANTAEDKDAWAAGIGAQTCAETNYDQVTVQ